MSGDGTGASGKDQSGAAAGRAADLEFLPGNAVLDAGAEGFGSGLFGGETGGKTLSKAGAGAAIGYFFAGKHALEKAVAVALDGAGDARDLDQVNAGADQHEATVAQE